MNPIFGKLNKIDKNLNYERNNANNSSSLSSDDSKSEDNNNVSSNEWLINLNLNQEEIKSHFEFILNNPQNPKSNKHRIQNKKHPFSEIFSPSKKIRKNSSRRINDTSYKI